MGEVRTIMIQRESQTKIQTEIHAGPALQRRSWRCGAMGCGRWLGRTRWTRWEIGLGCLLLLAAALGRMGPGSSGAPDAPRAHVYPLPAQIGPQPLDVDTSGLHQYWQVGLTAGPEARDADGMRTTIVTELPQRVASNTTNYFWIGAYLADGSFIQAGYYVPWYDANAAGWFYCAFTPAQQRGPCVYGPLGSAGQNGEVHTYTLEAAASASALVWNARLDGATIGQFAWTSATTGANAPDIYAESSGFAPHAADSQLGPVDFTRPVETRTAGQQSYAAAQHMRPAYGAPDVCPPYGASTDGATGALLGSGLGCPSESAWLW